MEICPKCGAIAYYDPYFDSTICTRCDYMTRRPKHQLTNADHIRSMSDIELAKEFNSHQRGCPPGWCTHYLTDHGYGCIQCWLDWLNKPYEEETI